MKFEKAKVNVVMFANEDVVTSSIGNTRHRPTWISLDTNADNGAPLFQCTTCGSIESGSIAGKNVKEPKTAWHNPQ